MLSIDYWFTFGYIIYIVVGVVGVAVSALFYYYIEKVLAKQYDSNRVAKALAWSHLILMNVGTTAATGMLMYAGYVTIKCSTQSSANELHSYTLYRILCYHQVLST